MVLDIQAHLVRVLMVEMERGGRDIVAVLGVVVVLRKQVKTNLL
jgi:hypothetical protein